MRHADLPGEGKSSLYYCSNVLRKQDDGDILFSGPEIILARCDGILLRSLWDGDLYGLVPKVKTISSERMGADHQRHAQLQAWWISGIRHRLFLCFDYRGLMQICCHLLGLSSRWVELLEILSSSSLMFVPYNKKQLQGKNSMITSFYLTVIAREFICALVKIIHSIFLFLKFGLGFGYCNRNMMHFSFFRIFWYFVCIIMKAFETFLHNDHNFYRLQTVIVISVTTCCCFRGGPHTVTRAWDKV